MLRTSGAGPHGAWSWRAGGKCSARQADPGTSKLPEDGEQAWSRGLVRRERWPWPQTPDLGSCLQEAGAAGGEGGGGGGEGRGEGGGGGGGGGGGHSEEGSDSGFVVTGRWSQKDVP